MRTARRAARRRSDRPAYGVASAGADAGELGAGLIVVLISRNLDQIDPISATFPPVFTKLTSMCQCSQLGNNSPFSRD